MKDAWQLVPALVVAVSMLGGGVLAVMVFGTMGGGSITHTPQATVVTLLALWGVGVGIGYLTRGGE